MSIETVLHNSAYWLIMVSFNSFCFKKKIPWWGVKIVSNFVGMYGDQKLMLGIYLCSIALYFNFVRQDLSMVQNMSFWQTNWPVITQDQPASVLCSLPASNPSPGVKDLCYHARLLHGAGVWTQIIILMWQGLCPQSHFPSPPFSFYYFKSTAQFLWIGRSFLVMMIFSKM